MGYFNCRRGKGEKERGTEKGGEEYVNYIDSVSKVDFLLGRI